MLLPPWALASHLAPWIQRGAEFPSLPEGLPSAQLESARLVVFLFAPYHQVVLEWGAAGWQSPSSLTSTVGGDADHQLIYLQLHTQCSRILFASDETDVNGNFKNAISLHLTCLTRKSITW